MRRESVRVAEIRMFTADELRSLADQLDNHILPEGTEHNPDFLIAPYIFDAPSGKRTLEVAFLKPDYKAETP